MTSWRKQHYTERLPVALQAKQLATLPVGTGRWTAFVGTMVLAAQTTVGTPGRGDATELAVLHGRGTEPVDTGIAAHGLVRDVDHNDLEVLERSILVDPVRIEDTEISTLACTTLLSDTAKRATGLQVRNASVAGLPIHLALVDGALAATTTNTDTIHAESLLGLVPETACLVGAGGAVSRGELTVLPGTDSLEEAEHITLLAVPHL